MDRISNIAKSVVASEVTDEMARQIRHFGRSQVRAIGHVFGGTWLPAPGWIAKENDKSVVAKYKTITGDDAWGKMVGFRLEYDYGSDTYDFTPFSMDTDKGEKWGRKSTDFYVEDLGDVSKLEYFFEGVKQ